MSKNQRKRRRYRSIGAPEQAYYPDSFDEKIMQEVNAIMNKQFSFTKDSSWTLPESPEKICASEPWEDDTLQKFKKELNDVKSLLSTYNIETWHKHTSFTNKAGNVMPYLKRYIKPEWCTQAWCKFYEIVSRFGLVPFHEARFTSVHLCEAPGAFIACLNHYMKCSGYSGQWRWLATTLNPYYEGNSQAQMIDEDRFISQTLNHWHFGSDNTGDLMSVHNIEAIQGACAPLGPVHLVTADGSIDCADNPGEQEMVVARLHLSELVTSLSVLASGGSLVLKMFTLFEDTSVSFMYLLNCCFDKVNVFKPATSKSGNSEVYVVCQNYLGLDSAILQKLAQQIESKLPTPVILSCEDIPASYMVQHRECCEMFMNYQRDTIRSNVELYGSMTAETEEWLSSVKEYCAEAYVENLKIMPIDNCEKVIPSDSKCTQNRGMKYNKRHVGSFVDRQEQSNLPWHEKIQTMVKYDTGTQQLEWLKGKSWTCDFKLDTWRIVEGKRVERVWSSKFCEPPLLRKYNDILNHSKVAQCDTSSDTPDFQAVLKEADNILAGYQVVATEQNDSFTDTVQSVCSAAKSEEITTCPKLVVKNGICSASSTATHPSLVHNVISTVLSLRVGDSVLFAVEAELTRAATDCLYVIHTLFEKMCIYDGQAGSQFIRLVLGHGYTGCSHKLAKYLQAVSDRCSQCAAETDNVVLQFIPVAEIYDSDCYTYVMSANNMLLKRRMNRIIDVELSKLKTDVELSKLKTDAS